MENGTGVAIAPAVLKDALHSEKFLTALITALIQKKYTMLKITHFIEKKHETFSKI